MFSKLFNKINKNKSKYTYLLDNGHGGMINGVYQTNGKRSPLWDDNTQLFEGEFNRDIVNRISEKLKFLGISYEILVPEQKDIDLKERVRRANNFQHNNGNSVLISVHANGGGGTGFEVYTSKGTTRSDSLATQFYYSMKHEFTEFKMRSDISDGDPDKEEMFYILKHTTMPALLTENFFMDRYDPDCKLLLSDKGRERIADAHCDAILSIEAINI